MCHICQLSFGINSLSQFILVILPLSCDVQGVSSLSCLMLQIIRKMEFVFASHNFDVWESWSLEGPLEECRLVNCRNTQVIFYFPILCVYMVKMLEFHGVRQFCYDNSKVRNFDAKFHHQILKRCKDEETYCVVLYCQPVIAIEVLNL